MSESGSEIVPKLGDFGFSLFVTENDPSLKILPGGSQPWNSPEWREQRPSNDFYKSDTYSMGLLIWAIFSPGEDPFNLGGLNTFSKLEYGPGDSDQQRWKKIDDLKASDRIFEIACQNAAATLASFDSALKSPSKAILRGRNQSERNLLEVLKVVFENTLRLSPELRALQPAKDAINIDTNSVTA